MLCGKKKNKKTPAHFCKSFSEKVFRPCDKLATHPGCTSPSAQDSW